MLLHNVSPDAPHVWARGTDLLWLEMHRPHGVADRTSFRTCIFINMLQSQTTVPWMFSDLDRIPTRISRDLHCRKQKRGRRPLMRVWTLPPTQYKVFPTGRVDEYKLLLGSGLDIVFKIFEARGPLTRNGVPRLWKAVGDPKAYTLYHRVETKKSYLPPQRRSTTAASDVRGCRCCTAWSLVFKSIATNRRY